MSKSIVTTDSSNQLAKVEDFDQLPPSKTRCFVTVVPASEEYRRAGQVTAEIVLRKELDFSDKAVHNCLFNCKTYKKSRLNAIAKYFGYTGVCCALFIGTGWGFCWASFPAFVSLYMLSLVLAKDLIEDRLLKIRCDCWKRIEAGRAENEVINTGITSLRELAKSPSHEPVELPLESVVLSLDDKSKAVRDLSLHLLQDLPQSMRERACDYFCNIMSPVSQYELLGNETHCDYGGRFHPGSLICIDWSEEQVGLLAEKGETDE